MSNRSRDAEQILEKALDTEMISAAQLRELLALRPARLVLLDIRTESEHLKGIIPGAALFPCDHNLQNLEDISVFDKSFHGRFDPEKFDPAQRYVLICRTGPRTAVALNTFLNHDLMACELLGGITEWQRQGFPLHPADTAAHPDSVAA